MHNSTQNHKTQNNSIFRVFFKSTLFEFDVTDSNSTQLETWMSDVITRFFEFFQVKSIIQLNLEKAQKLDDIY